MGQKGSKVEKAAPETPGDLFVWQQLDTNNEAVAFDPRFEDILLSQQRGELLISDIANNIFHWNANETDHTFGTAKLSKYEYQRNTNVCKHFDDDGLSLAWSESRSRAFYLDMESQKVSQMDIKAWLEEKYPNEKTMLLEKQLINLGKGEVLFLIQRSSKDETNEESPKTYDICHVNVIEKKEIKVLTIRSDVFSRELHHAVYWGFQYNPEFNCVSVLVRKKAKRNALRQAKELMFVLLVNLKDGTTMWSAHFDFIHDLSFNCDGKFMAIFERPKTTHGFVHVLNMTRLEWLCQIKLTYGGLPLGWDGFTWCADSLVFIKPQKIDILTPEEFAQLKKEGKLTLLDDDEEAALIASASNNKATNVQGLDEADANVADNAVVETEQKTNTDDTAPKESYDDSGRHILTPGAYDRMAEAIKGKEICVLGIGTRWWDVEKETSQHLMSLCEDENISHLILEYASLSWPTLQFDYPKFDETDKADQFKGAMTEVLESGFLLDQNFLLLSKMAKDPRTGIYNRWVFYITPIARNFAAMWDMVRQTDKRKIRSGVVGNNEPLAADK